MKHVIILTGLLLFVNISFAQYPGPIMDSLKKYQLLIQSAQTTEEKIRLASKLQKLMLGKTSVDTGMLHHMPTSKAEALKNRDKQVAEINKLKKNIDTSHSRQDKYAVIQKLLGKNDSIIKANKDAGKHAVIQQGLITLPNAEEFTVDQFAHVDTSQVIISFQYHKAGHNKNGSDEASISASSSTATMYRQNGIIIIRATNGQLPEFISKNNTRFPIMDNHHDIYGSASSFADKTVGTSNHMFGFAFGYNPLSNVYEVSAGAGMIWKTPVKDGHNLIDSGSLGFGATNDPATMKIPGSSRLKSGSANVAQFSKTQTGFAVSYNHDEDGVSESFAAEINLSPPRFEAFIEPADTAQYRKWLPKGPELTNYPTLPNGGKGNDLQLKVTLWDRQTKKEAADMYKAVIKLNNVSNMPGYCMNFPEDDKEADDKPDMRFDRADSAIYESWSTDKLTTRKAAGSQYVTIVSYDYGGIADVTADVTTPEGFIIKAHLRNSIMDTLTLPKRSNGSFIADYWKQMEGAEKKSDLADDEEIEKNDDRYPGDGLTLYEEYRGFLEKRKHFRGSAEKKDMMVCNKIATARSQDGIDNCEAVLNQYGNHVVMHSHFKEDEFGKKHDPDADELAQMAENAVTTPMSYNKCINYNNIKDLHLVDQHGIVLMNSDATLGFAIAVSKFRDPKNLKLGPPKNMYFLVITKDFNPKPEGWATAHGTLDSTGNLTIGEGKSKTITDEYARTVAHEMFHCFHIYHHGDENSLGRLHFFYANLRNSWEIDEGGDGKPLLDENNVFYQVKLFWEDDITHEIDPKNADVPAKKWSISGLNSTHSGVEDCIMRYDVARGYIRDLNIYLIRTNQLYREVSGINLCNSTIGTGVNKAGRKPMPRYGDAAPGRGDCIHQFCVSDKFD